MQPFYPTLSYNYAPPLDYGGGRCAVDYHCHIDVDFVFFFMFITQLHLLRVKCFIGSCICISILD